MATLAQLEAWRDRLADARFSGVRSVRDSSGEEVVYRSNSEMKSALSALDSHMQAATAGNPPSTIRFNTSKGLD